MGKEGEGTGRLCVWRKVSVLSMRCMIRWGRGGWFAKPGLRPTALQDDEYSCSLQLRLQGSILGRDAIPGKN